MNITIDGAKQQMPSGQNGTLGEVYTRLVSSLAKSGKVVATVEINGEAIPAGRIWDLSSQPITEVQALDLATRDAEDMVKEMMDSTGQHLELLMSETEKTATMFRVGDELNAQERFARCVSGFQWFLKALDALKGFLELDYAGMPMGRTTVERNIEDFVPLVDGILAAQAEGDVILLADLMEYELVPKLREWRKFLPELEGKTIQCFRHSS